MEGLKLTILKMGGSVITDKKTPLTPNLETIDALSERFAQVDTSMVLVHGGGSYGHYYAHQFGLGTELRQASKEGVSKTRMAMLELNLIVVKSLEKHGVHTYSLPPASLISPGRVAEHGVKLLKSILKSGLTPITYGDVMVHQGRYGIISGDVIVRMLAECLKPIRVIFALDVDGVYASNKPPYKVIEEIGVDDRLNVGSAAEELDVTGGMTLKLMEGRSIARQGVDVCFVNGLKPDRVLEALKGETFTGSLIKGIRSAGQASRR